MSALFLSLSLAGTCLLQAASHLGLDFPTSFVHSLLLVQLMRHTCASGIVARTRTHWLWSWRRRCLKSPTTGTKASTTGRAFTHTHHLTSHSHIHATTTPHSPLSCVHGSLVRLKHYVYFRVEPPASMARLLPLPTKSLANVITKLASAFWHGFYPAYYLFFLGAFVVNEMDDALRSRLRPLLTGETKEAALSATADGASGAQQATNSRQRVMSVVYGVIAWFCIFFCMNQLGMAFMLFQAGWSIRFWSTMYFSVFWAPALVIALCRFMLPKARSEGGKDGKGRGKGKHTAEGQAEQDNKNKHPASNGGGKKEL